MNNSCEMGRLETMIHLRPHHGVCLLNYRGKGYSNDFSANMTRMRDLLMGHPDTRIRITRGPDDLCARCPNRRENECESPKPPIFDSNVLRQTGLFYDQILTWKEFSNRTCPLSLYHLEETCPNCEWLELCKRIAKEKI